MKFARLAVRSAAVAAVGLLSITVGFSATNPTTPTIKSGFDLTNMDHSCKPCDDFNRFATGNWIKSHPIPAEYESWGNFEILQAQNEDALHETLESSAANTTVVPGSTEQKIGSFYRSCMNEAAVEQADLEPLKPELARIDAIVTTDDVNAEAIRLDQIASPVGWRLSGAPDRKDSSRTILFVAPVDLGLQDRDLYIDNDERTKAVREAYTKYLAALETFRGVPSSQARLDAEAVVTLETQFAKKRPSNTALRNPLDTYHPMTIADISRIAPHVAWSTYLGDYLATPTTTFNVPIPDSIGAYDAALVSTPIAVWKSYFTTSLLSAYSDALPKRYVDANFKLDSMLGGMTEQLPRWKRCVEATDQNLGDALGAVYVKNYFPPSSKTRALTLVNNLQTAMRNDIHEIQWMNPQTKTYAAKKLASLAKKIGYPDTFIDYSTLPVLDGPFIVNRLAAAKFDQSRKKERIGKLTDRTLWAFTPPTVNAGYNARNNEITIPAGILRPPFFSSKADDAVNYGAMGASIGHEMTHGFDDQGRKYDASGNQVDWWTVADSAAFDKRAKCIADEYSNFEVVPGTKGNGKLEQGEAIADLGGLSLAYRAFQKTSQYKAHKKIDGYTPEQRFFLAYAQMWAGAFRPEVAKTVVNTDPHPLNKWRVIGTLSNFPPFAKAFSCPATSAMVRAHRCEVW